jgi:hypothetical protein
VVVVAMSYVHAGQPVQITQGGELDNVIDEQDDGQEPEMDGDDLREPQGRARLSFYDADAGVVPAAGTQLVPAKKSRTHERVSHVFYPGAKPAKSWCFQRRSLPWFHEQNEGRSWLDILNDPNAEAPPLVPFPYEPLGSKVRKVELVFESGRCQLSEFIAKLDDNGFFHIRLKNDALKQALFGDAYDGDDYSDDDSDDSDYDFKHGMDDINERNEIVPVEICVRNYLTDNIPVPLNIDLVTSNVEARGTDRGWLKKDTVYSNSEQKAPCGMRLSPKTNELYQLNAVAYTLADDVLFDPGFQSWASVDIMAMIAEFSALSYMVRDNHAIEKCIKLLPIIDESKLVTQTPLQYMAIRNYMSAKQTACSTKYKSESKRVLPADLDNCLVRCPTESHHKIKMPTHVSGLFFEEFRKKMRRSDRVMDVNNIRLVVQCNTEDIKDAKRTMEASKLTLHANPSVFMSVHVVLTYVPCARRFNKKFLHPV